MALSGQADYLPPASGRRNVVIKTDLGTPARRIRDDGGAEMTGEKPARAEQRPRMAPPPSASAPSHGSRMLVVPHCRCRHRPAEHDGAGMSGERRGERGAEAAAVECRRVTASAQTQDATRPGGPENRGFGGGFLVRTMEERAVGGFWSSVSASRRFQDYDIRLKGPAYARIVTPACFRRMRAWGRTRRGARDSPDQDCPRIRCTLPWRRPAPT